MQINDSIFNGSLLRKIGNFFQLTTEMFAREG